jgi:signal transduction histidine kinase
LTTVKGYVQLCARLLQRPDLDRQRLADAYAGLERQVARQEGLIANLLDVARIQRGQLDLQLEMIDLVEVARTVVGRFEHAFERTRQHDLRLEAAAPVLGYWDADRLDQVLTNLVSNALKYSPDGGLVTVGVGRQGEVADMRVVDQGIGMTPTEQATLFQPFARGANGVGISGVGLGLFIVKQIVQQHHGTITVDSASGQGTTFLVQLPCGPPTSNAGL